MLCLRRRSLVRTIHQCPPPRITRPSDADAAASFKCAKRIVECLAPVPLALADTGICLSYCTAVRLRVHPGDELGSSRTALVGRGVARSGALLARSPPHRLVDLLAMVGSCAKSDLLRRRFSAKISAAFS